MKTQNVTYILTRGKRIAESSVDWILDLLLDFGLTAPLD